MENQQGNVPDSPRKKPLGRLLLDAFTETILRVVIFCFRFVGWTVRWTFATAFFLAIMAFAAYFVFNEAVKGGGHVEVPDVVGLPMTQAATVLAEASLEVGEQTEVASDRFPEYHVMLQRPTAGQVVREGKRVRITVSAGTDTEPTPDLTGQNLEQAFQNLDATRLARGSVARIPNDEERDTVLAQDPPPGREVTTGSEVHFLVSDGPGTKPQFMPDLVGQHVRHAMDQLATMDVEIHPLMVDRQADYDTVLKQDPDPGTLLQPGQDVRFEFRPLSSTKLPNARRQVTVRYTVPDTSFRPEIRVDAVDSDGRRGTIFPQPRDYVNGAPPRYDPGDVIPFKFDFQGSVTLEFYADGQLDVSYYFAGRRDPVITHHREQEFIEPPLEGEETGEELDIRDLEPAFEDLEP